MAPEPKTRRSIFAPAGDPVAALREVGNRLARRDGAHDDRRAQELMGWVDEAAAPFANAPIQMYVPVLVEHIVRERLRAAR